MTAAAARPISSATTAGSGRITARTLMAMTARSVVETNSCEWSVQFMTTVPSAITAASASTSRKLGSSPTGRRAFSSDQADCIARPHQAAEVVALADDEELHVGVKLEGKVRLRRAEAGCVDVESDAGGALVWDCLQVAQPAGVGAGRDQRDHPARQLPDLVPDLVGVDGQVAVRLCDGQVLEHGPLEPERAVRRQHGAAAVIGDQPDLTPLAVDLGVDGSGQADGVLERRLLAVSVVCRTLQVEPEHQVTGSPSDTTRPGW